MSKWRQAPDDETWIEFPDDMSDDEIDAALRSEYPPTETSIGQVPSGAEPLLYPQMPGQPPISQNRNEPLAGFSPDMAFQSLKDISRNMSNAVTFGYRDTVAPYLGSGRTAEEEAAATEDIKKRLDPSVRVGTGVAADMLLPVGEVAGMLARPAKQAAKAILPKGGWKAQVGKEADAQSAILEARKKVVTEKMTKDTARRKAFDEFGKNTKYQLTPAELEKLNKIVFGGPIRNAAVKTGASRVGNVNLPALITTGMAGEYGGLGGIKTMAALGSLGLLSKGVKGTAKLVGNRLGERDIQQLLETIKRGGV
jgi:hypothetical protein